MAVGRNLLAKQIEVYEEEWKQDRDESLRCQDLEEVLAVGIGICTALEHVHAVWRANVSRGVEEYRPEQDEAIQAMFRRWLEATEQATLKIAHWEDRAASVELAGELDDCRGRARQTLAGWVAPVKQRARGLLVDSLTEEEADHLERVLQSGEARLRITPRPL